MKNFKMEPVKLSQKADAKIRMRLFILFIKKQFTQMWSLKIAIPALSFFLVALFGVYHISENSSPVGQTQTHVASVNESSFWVEEIKEIRNDKYRRIAKQRLYAQKARKYKQYSYIRSSSLRAK